MRAAADPRSARGGLPVTLMRGGTSKGVFVRAADLPAVGPARDAVLLDLMGSPDPMQLDGLGGTHSSTSKVVVVEPSSAPGADVDYAFAQVGIETAVVDHVGNCGNLASAVGPYAVDAGWVRPVEPVTLVRLRNLNTGARIDAHVPVVAGRAATTGEQQIAGVPTPGPRIVTEYLEPAGRVLGGVLPTGAARNEIRTAGVVVPVSLVDVAHAVAFVRAGDIGLDPDLTPAEVNTRPALLGRLEQVRAACAALVPAAAAASSPNLPRLVVLLPLRDLRAHMRVLGVSAGRAHHALPITSTLCAAAAACLPGTLPHLLAARAGGDIRIEHARGVVATTVDVCPGEPPHVRAVGVVRTARRLLDGVAHLRAPVLLPTREAKP